MSDEVERWKLDFSESWVGPHPDGQFVRATDYDTLKERADALADAVWHVTHWLAPEDDPEWDRMVEALAAYREAGPK